MSIILDENERSYSENQSFLAQLPVGLLEENLRTQFRDPENYRMDYISSFIDEYRYSEGCIEDPDEREELTSLKDEFVEFVENLINSRLGISIIDFGEMGTESQFDILLYTYRFFILQIRQNFLNLFVNYIEAHQNELVEAVPRRKDITSQAFRREVTEEDTIIIANLSEIMDICLSDERLDVDEFFKLCVGNEASTEWTIVNEKFDDFTLVGNFIPYYRKMLRAPMRIRIEGEIRNRILKKYRTGMVSITPEEK